MACECNLSLSNLGTPGCQPIMGETKKLAFIPTYANDGTKNTIDSTAITASTITDLINHADPSKRLYIAPLVQNVEDVRADPVLEEDNAGNTYFIKDGKRTFTGVFFKQSTTFLQKLEAAECGTISVYFITKDDQLVGAANGTDLDPVQIQNDSLYTTLVKGTDTEVQKVQINFTISELESDSSLRIITATEAGISFIAQVGLLDVNQVVTNEAIGGATSTLTMDYGSLITKLSIKGAVLADFALYNNTTASAVIITSVTESTDGVYDLVYPDQTASDSLTLTFAKNGYETTTSTYTV